MTKKLIIFDFDGVIVTGTNKRYIQCYLSSMEYAKAITKAQEPTAKKKILEHWGQIYQKEINSVVTDPIKQKETYQKFIKLLHTNKFESAIKKAPHIDACLDYLNENKFTPVISSGSEKTTLTHISNLCNINLEKFKDIQTGDMYTEKYQKPNPKMILDQIKKFNTTPKNTIYIGDAIGDIKMANAAKVTSVTVLTGLLTKKEAVAENPEFIINNLKELKEVLTCM
ncbi:HAD hydrolase-like protein [archaeon]|nr:HAD hydrolase-like protein [archaeon]